MEAVFAMLPVYTVKSFDESPTAKIVVDKFTPPSSITG